MLLAEIKILKHQIETPSDSVILRNPLSRKIPALFIKTSIRPKLSFLKNHLFCVGGA